MALVVEDGSGMIDADALISVEFADAYFAARGNAEWSQFDPEKKEQMIVLASDYISIRWGPYIDGILLVKDQSLTFPRNLWDGVPMQVKRACAEYALRAGINGSLWPDPEVDASGMVTSSIKEKVGPIEESREYGVSNDAPGRALQRYIPYPLPDGMMRAFTRVTQGRVIRA